MKLLKLITILLIGLISIAPPSIDAASRKRKKAKVSASTPQAKKNSSKRKSTQASSKRTKRSKTQKSKYRRSQSRVSSSLRRSRSARATSLAVNSSERRAEIRRMDSLRLRNGGTEPIPRMGEQVETIANIEPILVRFRKADSTLTMRHIESLYFAGSTSRGDSTFWGEIVPEVDAHIAKERYVDALTTAQKGLFQNPTHLALLKRACELAQHEKHNDLDTYLWQISELLNLIQHTGDGKSPKTALCVMDANDALIYENLWLDTDPSHILSRKTIKHSGKDMLVLSLHKPKGKSEERYYRIGR